MINSGSGHGPGPGVDGDNIGGGLNQCRINGRVPVRVLIRARAGDLCNSDTDLFFCSVVYQEVQSKYTTLLVVGIVARVSCLTISQQCIAEPEDNYTHLSRSGH